ncbi:MAG: tail fiber protein [Flavipsychrobacter sp.]
MSETVTNVCTLGEIRMAAFGIAPAGWSFCEGQVLPISDYTALYSIIGLTYGGDGRVTFGLPDLRGRAPIGPNPTSTPPSSAYILGQKGGLENVPLVSSNLPNHTHTVNAIEERVKTAMPCSDEPFGNVSYASGGYPGVATAMYSSQSADTGMAPGDATVTDVTVNVSYSGSDQSHTNMQPFLVLNFIICTVGNYPTRS